MAFLTKLDQVAEKLREQIIAGEYARGQKLKQADIALELGVSVTPVREALKVLEMEGYIVSHPHQGLSVPELDYDDAQEIIDLRLTLERDLTRRAIPNLTAVRMESLKAAQRDFAAAVKAGDLLGAGRANVRFHFKLYEVAERPQTLQFVRVLWAKCPFNFERANAPSQIAWGKVAIRDHNAFLKYAAEGDIEMAVNIMCEHIDSSWENVRKLSEATRSASRPES
ncbi:GntR family transcriptional regulator [Caballeronia sp. GaOx3]|uniref:GntR family transcriptional regulator n=1 Tax=Caballeronia sp. GaOx3 TaxID=2921740 RepID=UPI0020292CB1|nr:GntR family transcriptional regulator [Caballeronia sp. GaOx3]